MISNYVCVRMHYFINTEMSSLFSVRTVGGKYSLVEHSFSSAGLVTGNHEILSTAMSDSLF